MFRYNPPMEKTDYYRVAWQHADPAKADRTHFSCCTHATRDAAVRELRELSAADSEHRYAIINRNIAEYPLWYEHQRHFLSAPREQQHWRKLIYGDWTLTEIEETEQKHQRDIAEYNSKVKTLLKHLIKRLF